MTLPLSAAVSADPTSTPSLEVGARLLSLSVLATKLSERPSRSARTSPPSSELHQIQVCTPMAHTYESEGLATVSVSVPRSKPICLATTARLTRRTTAPTQSTPTVHHTRMVPSRRVVTLPTCVLTSTLPSRSLTALSLLLQHQWYAHCFITLMIPLTTIL